MSSLGFRSPQFSEDFAWLPTWLQNPQLEASGNSFKEPQSNFSQIETLSREEGRYNSCHLFLSGDDTSQTTLSPSPGNVLHLRLRLSSDGESQAKGIPRFHCETSSLSESGGVAADEYSFVQNHETGWKIPSQSSKPFEGALDKADEGNFNSQELQTTKFLYGCAVNAVILKVKWLADSIAAGSRLHPEKYMILGNRAGTPYAEFGKSYHYENSRRILDRVGIMLHGKPSFCTKLALIIKHGGGQVFKTLQRLFQRLDGDKISVGAIIAEDDNKVSRHLKHCASERKLAILPASWIAKSLHLGTLLSLKEKEDIPVLRAPHLAMTLDWSQEI
ncbi:uncharacterized protein [Euphorbia lathyris]|uniref:uncharacterized protein isoform X1 n=1 Tax=Euphorbia lathyris TaxID=212925 RepID=UPI00331375D2